MKTLYSIFILLLLSGCFEHDATINFYNKKKEHISCLRLVVFPPDEMINSTLQSLYDFDPSCPYELQASKKSGITCNSSYNAEKKALGSFPSGYIRLDVYDKYKKPYYSYYRDMSEKVTKEDVKEAFERLQKDLL